MPRCLQLFSKETSEIQSLNKIDEDFCAAFDIPIHQDLYGGGVFDWFNSLGFCLVTCNDKLGSPEFEERFKDFMRPIQSIKTKEDKQEYELSMKILKWFESKYTSTAFYQQKSCSV